MQKWKTSIYNKKDGELYVRGEKFTDLIGKASFTEAIFLVLLGKKPSETEGKLLDIVLVSALNHGLEAPSSFVPRVIASTGTSTTTALASGIMAVGDYHGGAIEECMKVLTSGKTANEIVKNTIEKKSRVLGFGHKVYKDADPRSIKIKEEISSLGIESKYWNLAEDIQKELKAQTGKDLPLNIDGAMAAVLCELGFDPIQGKAFFALSRFPSMMANIEEELKNEKPYRRLDEEDIEFNA